MKTNIWPKKKISWLFDVIGSGTTPSASKEIYYSSPDMAWLNTGDLTDSYVERTTKYVSKQALKDFSALTVFPKESLVMAMYGATIGKLGITKYETTTNQACCVLGQPKGITTKFTFYWLMGHRSEIINLSQGGGQPNISQGIIRNIRIAVPPLELQNKIVAFIDKKFDETNLLINKKEQMIKLLEQQRQSIITEAVTKGLNPNVKMKDSGVEWIGEIPEHWNTSLLKLYLDKLTDGSHFSPEMMDVGYPYITVKDLKYGNIDLENALKISEEDYNVLVKNGCQPNFNDVLLSKDGTIGKVAVVKENEFVILSSLAILRPNNYLDSSYLSFWLESLINKNQMESFLAGAALRRLTLQTIKKLRCIIPPLNEQLEIIKSLKERLIPLDESILLVSKQIEKLKEYRQALIYEAVTGKIDVRDMEID